MIPEGRKTNKGNPTQKVQYLDTDFSLWSSEGEPSGAQYHPQVAKTELGALETQGARVSGQNTREKKAAEKQNYLQRVSLQFLVLMRTVQHMYVRKYTRSVQWVEPCVSNIHIYPEPQTVTLFGNLFLCQCKQLSQDQVILDWGEP